jgi:adenosine deaminase CECR1
MAHEFYQVMVGAPTISLHSWKQLAKWSLEYSCLSEDEKKLSQGILEESWKEFCKTVIQKYGGLMIKGDDETMILDEIKAGKMYAGLKPEQTSRESWNWASWMTAFMHRRRISRMSVKRGV